MSGRAQETPVEREIEKDGEDSEYHIKKHEIHSVVNRGKGFNKVIELAEDF